MEIKNFNEFFENKNEIENSNEKFSLEKLKKSLIADLKEFFTFDEDSITFKDLADILTGKRSAKEIFAEKDKVANDK